MKPYWVIKFGDQYVAGVRILDHMGVDVVPAPERAQARVFCDRAGAFQTLEDLKSILPSYTSLRVVKVV